MKLLGKQILCFLFVFCFIFETTRARIKEEDINLQSDYVIMVRLDNDVIVYEKNAHEKMYPASMTKMMTTLVAIEAMDDLQATCTITKEMLAGLAAANASVAGFVEGEVVSYEDLLYAILLPSGADATNAVAFTLFGSQEAMVAAMNAKAKTLGMKDTHYVNGSGLHNDAHYTTAYDISLLLKHALKNDLFKTIFCTPTYQTSNGRLTLYATMFKQMKNMETSAVATQIQGGKTGYTLEASLCLASYAIDEAVPFMMISGQTHSDNQIPYHVLDAYTLYEEVFQRYEKQAILAQGDVLGRVDVKYAKRDTYEVKAPRAYRVMVDTTSKKRQVLFTPVQHLQAPLAVDTKLGTLIVEEAGDIVYEEDILLEQAIEQNQWSYYVRHFDACLYDYRYSIGGIVLLLGGVYLFKRNKTKRLRG